MNVCIDLQIVFLFLLATAVVNADRIKEETLPYDINVQCVTLGDSFDNVFCKHGFIINVINAHYGYLASNRNIRKTCSGCLESVPLNSPSYYDEILKGCNDKEHCNSNLTAKEFNDFSSCGLFAANDYVSIEFYCLPSGVSIETEFVCIKTSSQGTIDCTGNGVIQIVGAILGFQRYDLSSCRPGEYRCRIQPDLNHLEVLRSSCQGETKCQFNATTSIDGVDPTCDSLEYKFENVTYYCMQNSGTLVSRRSQRRTPTTTSTTPKTVPATSVTVSKRSQRWTRFTSPTPSTVSVTSVTHSSSSLSASSTTGGATIASEASTYTMVDNLGNETTAVTDTSPTDNTMSIIVGCVVGGVVLIILLLLLIFIVWRRRNSEDASKRRGNNSDKGVNGLPPNGVTTMVTCDTPQGMTHSDKEYDATPLSDSNNIPTYSLSNHPATALYDLAQDLPQPPVYWLAQEPSIPADTLAREPLADFYSEVEDLAEEPYLSLYSNSGFSKEIDKSNAGIYVNVTEPSNAAYSLVQKTNSSTHQNVEDPVGSASMPVNKFKFTKVKVDKEEEKVSALTRHQSVQRPEDDLVLRENSLYVATETHTPNDAVDELTLTENDLYV